MSNLSAIVFIPDDSAKLGLNKPLMLQNMMDCPVARWVSEALSAISVDRFFLVCHDEYLEEALACFPRGAEVVTTQSENPADLLHVFLSSNEDEDGQVIVVTRPVLLLSQGAKALADTSAPPPPEKPVYEIPLNIYAKPAPEPPLDNDTGIYRVSASLLMEALDGDFIFQDFLGTNGQKGIERDGAKPLNSKMDLLNCQTLANRDLLETFAENGASIWDLNNCYVSPTTSVGRGTVLMPGTILTGNTYIGQNCVIGPNSRIESCVIGDDCRVDSSHLYDSTVGSNTKIGPFAYVRPDCQIGNNIKIGDFVEVKNSHIGSGTKISHLSYIGDSDLGENINVGCGTVTVNYDGKNKFRTTVEDSVFIGCNANLVSPVTIGKNAYIAAGSTITKDVPENALGIARAQQSNRKDWTTRNR